MKLVHAADLHLDSPLRGLSRYEGAPEGEIRGATRRALSNLVDLCLEEEAALLLLAGDLFDGNWRDYSTGLFFASQMSRLRQGDVQVVLVRGNHDAASHVTKNLTLPDNVVELATRKPETHLIESLGIAVHGQGFAKRVVSEDLASTYPEALPDLFNIGLLHTSADGRPGHENYAPCQLQTLLSKGYDYWALGHVHAREVLCEDPWVVFPGNLQGRHIRECGDKGATLIALEDGRITDVTHQPLDTVRWSVVSVDVAGALDGDEVMERISSALEDAAVAADGRLLAARVELSGMTALHGELIARADVWTQQVRSLANDVEAGRVWVEKVKLGTRPEVNMEALAGGDGAIGQLLSAVATVAEDDEALAEFAAELEELRRRLPAELRDGEDAIRLDDPDFLREALQDVGPLLLQALLSGDPAS